jgi:hypothetical protein
MGYFDSVTGESLWPRCVWPGSAPAFLLGSLGWDSISAKAGATVLSAEAAMAGTQSLTHSLRGERAVGRWGPERACGRAESVSAHVL